ncbi:MAG TPA: hypothetical protein VFI05_01830 [Nitrospiraceae bacterium]|nr:hypothetical protein [Nitrospiraceae bacterium]
MGAVTFQQALEMIESLSEEERKSLVEIVTRRLTEERREEIAHAVAEARKDYASGDVRRGTVDDLLRDLRK